MNKIYSFLFFCFIASGTSCHNTNEQHTNYTDSSGMNQEDAAGRPNTTNAPARNTYQTDTTNNTSGPDNAAPKSTAQDSTQSTRQRGGAVNNE